MRNDSFWAKADEDELASEDLFEGLKENFAVKVVSEFLTLFMISAKINIVLYHLCLHVHYSMIIMVDNQNLLLISKDRQLPK